MSETNCRAEKISIFKRILKILGISQSDESSPSSSSLTETLKRIDKVEDRVSNIEQVTMSWTTSDLSEDQLREMGLVN